MALSGFEIAGIHLRSEHTLCLSLDAAIYVGKTICNLSVVQVTGAQTAWNAQQEQRHHAMAEAFVMKAWRGLEAAPARRALGEQPVKTVLLTTFLGPIVHQCAAVSMACATAVSMVTEPVSASRPTGAPGVTRPSLSVRPCSAQKTPGAHSPAEKPNSNANAFPVMRVTANTARPSTPV